MTTQLAQKTNGDGAAKARPETFVRPVYRSYPGSDAHELHVFMPGVKKEGVHVSLDGDDLTIIGHRAQVLPESWHPVFQELRGEDYRLRLRLNIQVDEGRIDAHVEDGMLYLTLPIHDAAKPRVIAVS